jgi:carbon monoxide dehydrogenase subunit G
MRVQGSYAFNTDIQTVWDSMLSPDVLASCIPGCDRIRPSGDDSYEVELTLRISAIRGEYKGEVRIENKQHLQSYSMVVTGSGRGGSVRGSGDLRFSESDGQTTVDVTGDTQATGVVARVGQRLLGGASRMMMDQFFSCLASKIEGSGAPSR